MRGQNGLDRKQREILGVLRESGGRMSGEALAEALRGRGMDISERTVRLYLQQLDAAGLTEAHGRRGRSITGRGLQALHTSRTFERVGFLSARIDQITYKMNFDLATRTGTVVVNVTVADPREILRRADMICDVFRKGYAMGHLIAVMKPGESCADTTIPAGKVGLVTVCSITLNGVLLKHGVPTHSRFGGLLELRDGEAVGFSEIITYDGTSIDPLVVFIQSGMTDYIGAVRTGTGRIGASFREFPADSRELVQDLAAKLTGIGLGAFRDIGYGGQTLLGIPVSEGRAGAIVIGGLNPVAILEESGVRVASRALAGLMDYNRLSRFEELPGLLRQAMR